MREQIDELAGQLADLVDYRYIVERYIVSLKQLTVVARHYEHGRRDPVYITFRTVEYMQMPTYWEAAPFRLGTEAECQRLLERIDVAVVERLPKLYYAQLPKSKVYVVCERVRISATMPKDMMTPFPDSSDASA